MPPRPRRLGKSELEVLPIAYGCWRFAGTDVGTARGKIEAALEQGIGLFDTADIYGIDDGYDVGAAEELLGKVLTESPRLRDRMVLATKCGIVPGVPYDSSADHVHSACRASLRRLGVERIDLYQIHRPDLLAHPGEVARALTRLRDEGSIREAGVSNFTPSQLDALQHHLPFPIASHQIEASVLRTDALRNGVLDQCLRLDVTPLAWSPLAGGRLGADAVEAGTDPDGPRLRGLLSRLDEVARDRGVGRTAVALAWLWTHPAGIVPIIGTQRPERIAEALRALDLRLSREEWYGLLEASLGEALP